MEQAQRPDRYKILLVLVLIVASGSLLGLIRTTRFFDPAHAGWDFSAFYFATIRAVDGVSPYWSLGRFRPEDIPAEWLFPYLYPPTSLLLTLPLAGLSLGDAGTLVRIGAVLSLLVFCGVLLRPRTTFLPWGVLVILMTLQMRGMSESLGANQFNVHGLALCFMGSLFLQYRSFWGASSAFAAAILLKPVCIFLLVGLVNRGFRRILWRVSLIVLVASLLSWALFGGRIWIEWVTQIAPSLFTPRVSYMVPNPDVYHLGLRGVIRLLSGDAMTLSFQWRVVWLVSATAVALVTVWRCVSLADSERGFVHSLALGGVALVLCSPLAWQHYLVFAFPAIIVLVDDAIRAPRWSHSLGIAFIVSLWTLTIPIYWDILSLLPQTKVRIPLGSAFAIVLLAFWVLLLVSRFGSPEKRSPQDAESRSA